MEQYMRKTRGDYGSSVTRPSINQDTNFKLKGQFLKELRDNTFSGSEHENANDHIEKVLEIVDLFHILKITQDQIMLRAFHVSLTGFITLENSKFKEHKKVDPRQLSTPIMEHEYRNPPNDSFPKPYLNISNERDKAHHNENNGDLDKLSGIDLSGAPQSEKINNEQPNEGVYKVDKFKVIKYTIRGTIRRPLLKLDMVQGTSSPGPVSLLGVDCPVVKETETKENKLKELKYECDVHALEG
ncbi:hypothetical protein Tco_0424180 [Tanacetum coccineum]